MFNHPSLRLLLGWKLLDIPDRLRILDDASIRREEAHSGNSRDTLRDPLVLVLKCLVDQSLSLDIAVEVIANKVVVPMVRDRVDKGGESILVAEHATSDDFKDLCEIRVDGVLSEVVGVTEVLDILGKITKEEDVGVTNLTSDFNLS